MRYWLGLLTAGWWWLRRGGNLFADPFAGFEQKPDPNSPASSRWTLVRCPKCGFWARGFDCYDGECPMPSNVLTRDW